MFVFSFLPPPSPSPPFTLFLRLCKWNPNCSLHFDAANWVLLDQNALYCYGCVPGRETEPCGSSPLWVKLIMVLIRKWEEENPVSSLWSLFSFQNANLWTFAVWPVTFRKPSCELNLQSSTLFCFFFLPFAFCLLPCMQTMYKSGNYGWQCNSQFSWCFQ